MTTHQIIVLDRSGSMETCRDATISGFNELIQTVQRLTGEAAGDLEVTLVTFNDQVNVPFFRQRINAIEPVTRASYEPNGGTAMLDAVGTILRRFSTDVSDVDGTRYIMTIVSDGEENASTQFSYATIAEMIQQRLSTGRWTFAYMGANQDLSEVARRMNLPDRSVGSYTSSHEGTFIGFDALAKSTSRSVMGMSSPDNFFGDDSDSSSKQPKKKHKSRKLH